MIAGNLTLNEYFYWLEKQLSAGHFGTELNHSRCTTSVADRAHLLPYMIEGFEDFCDFFCVLLSHKSFWSICV